jgi:Peptidase family C25/FG-GAP-like repeat
MMRVLRGRTCHVGGVCGVTATLLAGCVAGDASSTASQAEATGAPPTTATAESLPAPRRVGTSGPGAGAAGPSDPSRSLVVTDPLAGAPSSFSLLIVTDSSLASAAQPLVNYKNATGTPAFLTTMQLVQGAACSLAVCDDAARLKLTVQSAFEQHGATYVLLLGDVQFVPTRPVTGIATVTTPFPAGTEMSVYYQITDFYYANLYESHQVSNPAIHGPFSDWRDPVTGYYDTGYGTGDNNANNPSHVDGYPDLVVGRVPAENAGDVSIYVNKVIAFESGLLTPTGSAPYAWIADVGYPTSDTLTEGTIQSSGLPASRQTYVQVNYPSEGYGSPWQGAPWAEAADISDMVNDAWWVTYVGHGSKYGLDNWSESQIAGWNNVANVPIVFAAACQTGQYGPYLGQGYSEPYVDIWGQNHGYVLDDANNQATDEDQNNQVLPYPFTPAPMAIYQPHTYNDRGVAASAIFSTTGGAPSGAVAWIGDTIIDQDGHPMEEEGYALQGCQARLGDRLLQGQRAYWAAQQNTSDWFEAPRLFLTTQELNGDPSLRLPPCQNAEPSPASAVSWTTVSGANPPLPRGALLVGSAPDGTHKQYACVVSTGGVGQFVPGSDDGCLAGPVYTGTYQVLTDDRVSPTLNPPAWQVHTGDVIPANVVLTPSGQHGVCRAQYEGVWYAGDFALAQPSKCTVVNPYFSSSSFQVLVSQTAKRGADDVVWQNQDTGQMALWQMSSAGSISNYLYPAAQYPNPNPLPSTARLIGTGDFDGDGHGDFAFWDPVGEAVTVWKLDGTNTFRENDYFQFMSAQYAPQGVGDFDGDGLADILWMNTATRDVTVFEGNGTSLARETLAQPALPAAWNIQATGDFNGDGTTDVILRNSQTGDVGIWVMNAGVIGSYVYPQLGVESFWQIQGAGDFNGDRVTDVLWRDTNTGDVGVWVMNSSATISSYAYPQLGVEAFWVYGATGDFNGDGVTDIAWRNTEDGDVGIWLMSSSTSIQQYVYPQRGVEAFWQMRGSVSELVAGR